MSQEVWPRGGAVRHQCPVTHRWVVTNPGSALYSSALMCAQDYYDDTAKDWKPIFPEDEEVYVSCDSPG